jgi:hypothetical protein
MTAKGTTMKHTLTLLTALLLAPVGLGNGAAVGYPVPAMETLPPTKPPTSGSARNCARE